MQPDFLLVKTPDGVCMVWFIVPDSEALSSIPTRRRILLSGTPMQNDLGNIDCFPVIKQTRHADKSEQLNFSVCQTLRILASLARSTTFDDNIKARFSMGENRMQLSVCETRARLLRCLDDICRIGLWSHKKNSSES
jgi:hypothetical protein